MTLLEAQRRLQQEGATFHSRQPIQGGGVVDWYWSAGRSQWLALQRLNGQVVLKVVAATGCSC